MVLPEVSILQSEIILLSTAVFVLLIDAFFKQAGDRLMYLCTQLGLLACVVLLVLDFDQPFATLFQGQVVQDQLTIVLKIAVCGTAFLAYTYSFCFNRSHAVPQGSYFILSLLAILGALVLCSAQNLLLIYMGLELVTLPMLALIALNRDAIGAEAAMKYFVLSALASGFFLYGISLWYGLTGSLDLLEIARVVAVMPLGIGMLFAMVFVSIGLCFKLGVVPFHMWVPDAYQGAPTSVTVLLGSVSKLAAFALLFRVLIGGFSALTQYWQLMLFAMAVLSVMVGNIVALAQQNIKRLLAYSTIAHMGFVLFGFAEGTALGLNAALFYILTYVLSAVAAFGVIMLLTQEGKPIEMIKDLSGLSTRHPLLATVMMLALFSMAGIPPFVGFDAKLLVIKALVAKGHEGFALLALLLSVVGAYYYIRVIKIMFFEEPSEERPVAHKILAGGACGVLCLNGLALLVLGILPAGLMTITQAVVI